jgi:hypothetical protein
MRTSHNGYNVIEDGAGNEITGTALEKAAKLYDLLEANNDEGALSTIRLLQ